MEPKDVETAILLRMYQCGLVAGRYRSIQDVRRSIGWIKMASHYHVKKKFGALARSLVKKGMLTDDGKSMKVLSLTMRGTLHVKKYMAVNPRAVEWLNRVLEG